MTKLKKNGYEIALIVLLACIWIWFSLKWDMADDMADDMAKDKLDKALRDDKIYMALRREGYEVSSSGNFIFVDGLPETGCSTNIKNLNNTECKISIELLDRQLTNGDLKILSELENVTSVDLHGIDNRSDMSPLASFPKLERLSINDGNLKDEDLAFLAQMNGSQLKYLSLSNNAIDGRCLKWIAKLTNLRHLNLSSNQIDDNDMVVLGCLNELVNLEVSSNRLTWNCIQFLPENIVCLDLKGVHFDVDSRISSIGRFKKLRRLRIGGSNLNDLHLQSDINFPEFETLDIHDSKVTNVGLSQILKSFSNLYELDIGVTSIRLSEFGCNVLSDSVEEIDLCDMDLDENVKTLFPKARTLYVNSYNEAIYDVLASKGLRVSNWQHSRFEGRFYFRVNDVR